MNSITVYYCNIAALNGAESLTALFNASSPERRQKALNKAQIKDKASALVSGLLLNYALKDFCGKSDFEILTAEHGKPYIKNGNVHFNISHSANYVICAVSYFNIGCDIEKIRPVNLNIANRFFTQEEYKNIINSANVQDSFFEHWVLKESYIKFLGTGLKTPLDSFNINSLTNCFLTKINIADGYKSAVCAAENAAVNLKQVNIGGYLL